MRIHAEPTLDGYGPLNEFGTSSRSRVGPESSHRGRGNHRAVRGQPHRRPYREPRGKSLGAGPAREADCFGFDEV